MKKKIVCCMLIVLLSYMIGFLDVNAPILSEASADSIFSYPLKGYQRSGGETGGGWFCPNRNVGYGDSAHLAQDCTSSTSNYNVYPVYAGTVYKVDTSMTYGCGRYVIIKHVINGITVWSEYQHLTSDIRVQAGDPVTKDTVIAIYGTSGAGGDGKYARHLHYEIFTGRCDPWISGPITSYALNVATLDVITAEGTTYYNPDAVIKGTVTIPGVNDNPYEKFEFRNVVYPKVYKLSSNGWDLSGGTLVSNTQLKTIKTTIIRSSDGYNVSGPKQWDISGYSYSIIRLDTKDGTNNGVRFSYLDTSSEAGSYIWRLEATDINGRYLKLDMPFTADTSATQTATIASWSIDDMEQKVTAVYIGTGIEDQATTREETFYLYDDDTTFDFYACVDPFDATNDRLSWSSSNTNVLQYQSETYNEGTSIGHFKVKGVGKTVITATAKDGSGKKATYTITLCISSISLSPQASQIRVGETTNIIPTIVPSVATNSDITWESSNSSVATVDQSGNVTAVSEGTATITAKAKSGDKKGSCTITVLAAGGSCGDNATWVYKDGKLTISGSGTIYNYNVSGAVPWVSFQEDIVNAEIKSGITGIGKYTFGNCINLKSVSLPTSLTSIGQSAFYHCEKLTAITIPSSVTSIGISALAYCKSLTSLILPSGIKVISEYMLSNCTALQTLTIPSGVTRIDANAMSHCDNLTSITIPNSVTSIGFGAFAVCGKLSSVTIPASVTSIGEDAFAQDSQLTIYCYIDSAAHTYAQNNGIPYILIDPVIHVTGVTLEYESMGIGLGGSYNLASMLGLTVLPENATNKNVVWSSSDASVANVDSEGRIHANKLGSTIVTARTVDGGYTATCEISTIVNGSCSDDVFWSYWGGNNLLIVSGSGPIPDYTENNPAPWTQYAGEIRQISINPGITGIGPYAFYECINMTSVYIPSSVLWIDYYAFYNCQSLQSIAIQGTECQVSGNAFDGCINMTYIWVSSQNNYYTSIDGALYTKNPYELFICPRGWTGHFTIPSGVTGIGPWSSFTGCTEITGVTIPSSVIKIGDGAFMNCTKLTSLSIPDSVKTIGASAFVNSGLTNIRLPSTLTVINNNLFYMCENLTNVVIPENVKSIGKAAFGYCSGLVSVTIPNTVTSIADNAFVNANNIAIKCYAGTTAHLYARTTGIAYTLLDTTFTNPDFTLPVNTKNIDSEAFSGIAAKRVKLPEDIQAIRTLAFADCPNLVAIYIPEGCTTIAADAFSGVTNLTIFGAEGSYAAYYADRHGFDFVSVGSNP